MSTAIELQDVSVVSRRRTTDAESTSPSPESNSTPLNTRKLSVLPPTGCKGNPNAKVEDDGTSDENLTTLHDDISTSLPLDTTSLRPDRVFWVTPHNYFTKTIKVLDLTPFTQTPYTGMSDAYKNEAKEIVKSRAPEPTYMLTRENWVGRKYSVTDSSGESIADWKHSWTSVGTAMLTFPDDSPHCSHTIELKNKCWGRRTETFVVDSATFVWKPDSFFGSHNMTLYKVLGKKKVEVGKYSQKWWGAFLTGGTLVLDTRELDELIGILSLAVVLKKKRQRAAERSGGGGGGGGGGA
ncbi:hypothetical protein AOQ84DRAFT_442186 [Glonium stellatum]|uniref:Uncharacterized protein n=1 Tax=Glonium stellatum TaxID=574774 RepID=A0A8E2ETX4_9PEZI|nr:hypothetical protein AOQ84DRAFT_442186 [Glonium stellatum]